MCLDVHWDTVPVADIALDCAGYLLVAGCSRNNPTGEPEHNHIDGAAQRCLTP